MAARERENAAAALARAELYERTADEIERLTPATKTRRLVDMDTHTERRRRGRPVTTGHPLHAALAERGESVASRYGKRRTTVQDWISGRRPIPRLEALALERELDVPLSSWPRISD